MSEAKQNIAADVIVIGAGVYGVQFARTYLEIHPEHELVVLEADDHVGGPWAEHRIYDSFVTQSPTDFLEFSDKPLVGVPQDELHHGHVPARYYTRYLEEYIDEHVYDGRTLRSRIHFNTRVQSLTKDRDCWRILTMSGEAFTAAKVVDAVGLTSQPNIPKILGSESYSGVHIHHKDFGQSDILENSNIHAIAVLGGAKSAADMAYAAAKAGKTVHWIIRKTGCGPAWFVPARSISGSAKCSTHELWIRFVVPLFVSIFAEHGRVSKLLYRSPIGQKVFWNFWALVEAMLVQLSDFDRKDGQQNGFHNLRPDTNPFWANDSTAVANKSDFFDTIAKHVHVYREDVKKISGSELELVNGTKIPADAILYGTGWTSDLAYIDKQLATRLGLPVPGVEQDKKTPDRWQALHQEADAKIREEMPVLSRAPPYRRPESNRTPLRLYKSMLPIQDHSIVFLGKAIIAHAFPVAEVEALWAIAVLDGRIVLPPAGEMERDVAKVVAWSRRRYLTHGWSATWFPWDLIPFTDMLLKQLGLLSHRGSSWWSDRMTPSYSRKLKGLIEEYKRTAYQTAQ